MAYVNAGKVVFENDEDRKGFLFRLGKLEVTSRELLLRIVLQDKWMLAIQG